MKRERPTWRLYSAERMVLAVCMTFAGRSSFAFVTQTPVHRRFGPLVATTTTTRHISGRLLVSRSKHSAARRRRREKRSSVSHKGLGGGGTSAVNGSVNVDVDLTRNDASGEVEEEPRQQLPFETDYHVPVVCREVLQWLITNREGVYVDCTLGGGGHSAALLGALSSEAKVVGLDRDPAALKEASARLSVEAMAGRFQAVRSNFADITHAIKGCELLRNQGRRLPSRTSSDAYSSASGMESEENDDDESLMKVDGILVDLGVSSRQIDDGARGFSFSKDGPLDMRMDHSAFDAHADSEGSPFRTFDQDFDGESFSQQKFLPSDRENQEVASQEARDDRPKATGNARPVLRNEPRTVPEIRNDDGPLSAADVVNFADEREIREVIFRLGEETRSTKIARAIVTNRPIKTTGHLAEVVGKCAPPNTRNKTLARVFQALRIKVNGELDALEALLYQAKGLVKPGGRLLVLSYHSLEDRRVKRVLATGNLEGAVVKDFYGNQLSPWKPLTRKPLQASDGEVALNSRARSVRLRVAERTNLP